MNLKHLFVAVPATLLVLGNGAANAGQIIDRVGAIACITDKWDEKEPEKGHKLVELGPTLRVGPERRGRGRLRKTALENTITCPTRVGRAPAPALIIIKVARSMKAGKRDRTSRNTRGNIPVAPANMKAPAAAVRISTKA